VSLDKNKLPDTPEKDDTSKPYKKDAQFYIGTTIQEMKKGGSQAPAGDGCPYKSEKGPDIGETHPSVMNEMHS